MGLRSDNVTSPLGYYTFVDNFRVFNNRLRAASSWRHWRTVMRLQRARKNSSLNRVNTAELRCKSWVRFWTRCPLGIPELSAAGRVAPPTAALATTCRLASISGNAGSTARQGRAMNKLWRSADCGHWRQRSRTAAALISLDQLVSWWWTDKRTKRDLSKGYYTTRRKRLSMQLIQQFNVIKKWVAII